MPRTTVEFTLTPLSAEVVRVSVVETGFARMESDQHHRNHEPDQPGWTEELDLLRLATTKHLAVLEAVGLVRSTRRGRSTVFEARTEPLTSTAAELTAAATRWSGQLDLLKRTAEAASGGAD